MDEKAFFKVPLDQLDSFAEMLFSVTMESMMEAKVEHSRNGPADLDPKIMYIAEGQSGMTMIAPIVIGPEMPPPAVLQATLGQARQNLGPPLFVAFACEAWMKLFEHDKRERFDQENYQRGDFAKDPEGVECLTLAIVHRQPTGGLRMMYTSQPYHYGDGTVIFDEAFTLDTEGQMGDEAAMEGSITSIIRQAFEIGSN